MSTQEPVITDLFASPQTWESPYPGYARFRGDSPIGSFAPKLVMIQDNPPRWRRGSDASRMGCSS